MTARGTASPAEAYSPRRRTALVLTGSGTAGAYHAGALRALHEAGVKLDVVAGRGMGAVGALFAAVDGAQRLWDDKGFWRAPAAGAFYPWRLALRIIAVALGVAVALVAVPLAVVAAGLVVYPIDFVAKMIGVSAGGPVSWYLGVAQSAFAPDALPTWVPRLVLLALGGAAAIAAAVAWMGRDRRRRIGPAWWRLVPAPLTAAPVIDQVWSTLWDLIRGAAPLKRPPAAELGRRYTEMLSENIGQPGFRELLIAVHDLDAGRDLIFALVGEARRAELVRRPTTDEAEARRAEVVDLAGVGRGHLADAVAASLSFALATEPHIMTFAPDAYWRGEAHRLCDRPAALNRLLEELARIDVEQVVLVTAAPAATGPHTLAPARLDGPGRVGEYLQSSEAAVVRDAVHAAASGGPRVFVIRPGHNPVGPLDFAGGFDAGSDRRQPLVELMSRGYEDAYLQFIEPILGASGDRVGAAVRGRK